MGWSFGMSFPSNGVPSLISKCKITSLNVLANIGSLISKCSNTSFAVWANSGRAVFGLVSVSFNSLSFVHIVLRRGASLIQELVSTAAAAAVVAAAVVGDVR